MKTHDPYSWILAVSVLISRVLNSGPVYWADGPAHLRAIRSGMYVIQPPGYWLLNRVAGQFANPEIGLQLLNWTFSVAGVVVFYWTAKLLVSKPLARLGAACYAVIFYVWFSGGVHSSYASQILFPVLVFYLFLRYRESSRLAHLLGASVAFAVGAGLRPSDGAFLLPLFIYFVLKVAPRRHVCASFVLVFVACMAWLVPTYLAYSRASASGVSKAFAYVSHIMTIASIVDKGITKQTLADIMRYLVPLSVAFLPLCGAIFATLKRLREERIVLLWLWILPGSLFFILSYMADATYLNYLTAAVMLLALVALDGKRKAMPLVTICLSINAMLFLFFTPLASKALPVQIINAYSGKYTRYGIKHQWQPNLSTLMKAGSAEGLPPL